MSTPGRREPGTARLTLVDPTAGPEEAAAIVVALERFIRDMAPPPQASHGASTATDGWRLTGLLEGVEREPPAILADPWINT